ncbi:hypothetical protein [Emticicia sp. SJ17W-69]|uniref:hypothetical protein n=1 Tax=Emticicia sp. SJ17W-69 TaxID=3421657 RepID=UPI003EBB3ED4
MNEALKKYNYLLKICNEINNSAANISSGEIKFFEEITVIVKFSNSELCFNSLISWLYILFHENSSKNIDFIRKKITAYNISLTDDGINLKKLVHAFRTIFQHQMDFINSRSDIEKRNLCHSWYYEVIIKQEPVNETDWNICINKVLDSAIEMLNAVLTCLKEIKKSEHLSLVIDEWEKTILRNYTVHDFEKILIKVLSNLGLEGYFDTNVLVKKNINSWRKELDILPDDFNFEIYGYKILERFIIKKEIIPIDGHDLISIGFPKGKVITDLLLKAREIFYNNPCNKQELLLIIKEST